MLGLIGWLARLVIALLDSSDCHSDIYGNWGERSEPRTGEVNAYTRDMEVILRPETNRTLSPKKIKVDPDRFAVKDSDINMKDVDSMARFKQVSLYAKVIRVDRRSSCCF